MRPLSLVLWLLAGVSACSYHFERTAGWTQPESGLLIAHALGEVGGITYSNSAEALARSVARGYRWLEVDLHLTDGGDLVCFHSGDEAYIGLEDHRVDEIPTGDFLARKYRGLTTMGLEDLLRRIRDLPDVILVTDTKGWDDDLAESLIRHARAVDPALARRLVPQIYRRRDVDDVNLMQRELGDFHSLIFTLYRTRIDLDDAAAWVARERIPIVTVKKARVTRSLVADFHAAGASVMTHTVNDAAEIERLTALGVDGFYTDSYTTLAAQEE